LLPLALLIVVVNDDDQVSLAPLFFLPLLAVIDFLGEWLVPRGLLLVSDDKLRLSDGVGNMVLLVLEALLFIMISHHSLRALHTINAELTLLSPARLIDLTLQTLRVQEVFDPGIRVVCHLDQLLVIIFARFLLNDGKGVWLGCHLLALLTLPESFLGTNGRHLPVYWLGLIVLFFTRLRTLLCASIMSVRLTLTCWVVGSLHSAFPAYSRGYTSRKWHRPKRTLKSEGSSPRKSFCTSSCDRSGILRVLVCSFRSG